MRADAQGVRFAKPVAGVLHQQNFCRHGVGLVRAPTGRGVLAAPVPSRVHGWPKLGAYQRWLAATQTSAIERQNQTADAGAGRIDLEQNLWQNAGIVRTIWFSVVATNAESLTPLRGAFAQGTQVAIHQGFPWVFRFGRGADGGPTTGCVGVGAGFVQQYSPRQQGQLKYP